ncbi:MAG: hypothetical protein OEV49_14275 [candidate division Zixibacteria bacterium]|nr:hypothetical protein [candidate division Zixibacteria bacterium]MDH3937794.1 hypothetical protein [candidate division Zixibacteria bacterium]MDH4035512.1 hypothetical protein [candidate division Zixibacteria bacterium]
MKFRIAMVVAIALAFSLVAAPASVQAQPTRVTDCVGPIPPGFTYIITPGFWTRNGVVIGVTFPAGGSIPPPPNPKCHSIVLPNPPNDFHYNGDVLICPLGNITVISASYQWNIGFLPNPPIIVGDTLLADSIDLDLNYDYTGGGDDPYMMISKNGAPVYEGLLSGADLEALQLDTVGYRELTEIEQVPSLTNWGMLVLMVLLVISGVYVIYYRRRGIARP